MESVGVIDEVVDEFRVLLTQSIDHVVVHPDTYDLVDDDAVRRLDLAQELVEILAKLTCVEFQGKDRLL